MCGCRGTYSETERAKKLALTKILKQDYKVQLWGGDHEAGCIFVETDTRNNVIYLKPGTVLPAEMMEKVIK
jgi:hypothetical protein